MPTEEQQKKLDADLIKYLGKERDLVKAEQALKEGANPDTQDVGHREGQRVTLLSIMAVTMPAFIMNGDLSKREKNAEIDVLKQSMSLLIKYDADVNFQNKEGKTILKQLRDAAEAANRDGNEKLVEVYRELDQMLLSNRARIERECNPPELKKMEDGREFVEGDVHGHHVKVFRSAATGGVRIEEEGVGQISLYPTGDVMMSKNTAPNAYEIIAAKGPEAVASLRQAAEAALKCGQFGPADEIVHGLLGQANQQKNISKDSLGH